MKRLSYFVLAALCLSIAFRAAAQPPTHLIRLEAKVSPRPVPAVELHWVVLVPTFAVPTVTLYRSMDDSLHFSPIAVTQASAYTDLQVMEGHTYFYVVGGGQDIFRSNIVSVDIGPHPPRVTGTIEGTVTDSLTGHPLPFATVLFFRPSSPVLWLPQVLADSAGHYHAVLDTGTYLVLCQPPAWMVMSMSLLPPYRQEWYKDAADPAHATPVPVAEGSVTKISFDLVRFTPSLLAHIRGTVRDSMGTPLRGAAVAIQSTVQAMIELSAATDPAVDNPGESFAFDGLGVLRGIVWKGVTDSSGMFGATVIAGRAYIAMAAKEGFFPQFYDHKNSPLDATIIHLSGDVGSIDFNLNPIRPPHLFSISGVVKDSTGVLVPSRIIVFPLRPRAAKDVVRFGYTDSLGAYTVPRLLPGKYIVFAIPFGRYAPAFYKKGAFGIIRWKEADTVAVAGDVAGIDIGVVSIHCTGVAQLHGVVRSGGQPLDGVNVLALTGDGAVVGYGLSDDAGAYVVDGLATGPLTLVADCEGYTTVQQPLNVGPSDFALTRDITLGVATSAGGEEITPKEFTLLQNYPNPFNPSTRIRFTLPVASNVNITVFNLLGQDVATLVNALLPAGEQTTVWNGRDASGRSVASGIYFYRLVASGVNGGNDFTAMRKMILLK
jgi:hypothetical protein